MHCRRPPRVFHRRLTNVVCQPGYMAKEAIAAATDGLGDGRESRKYPHSG